MQNLLSSTTTKTMSSIEIAKLVESRHDSVKLSIERLAKNGIIHLPPLVETPNNQGVMVKTPEEDVNQLIDFLIGIKRQAIVEIEKEISNLMAVKS